MKTGLLAPRDFLNIHFLSRTPLSSAYYFYVLFCLIIIIIRFVSIIIVIRFFFFVASLSLGRGGVIFVTSPKPLKFVMPRPLWTVVHDRTVLARS